MTEIRQRHIYLVQFDEQAADQFKFEKDKVVVTDFDSPVQTRVTVPFKKLSQQLQDQLRGRRFQVSYSKPGRYNRNVPFKTVQELGWRVDVDVSTGESGWDGIEKAIDRVVGYKFNSSNHVETPNWRSIHDHNLDLSDLGNASELFKHIGEAQVPYADSILVNFGTLPFSANDIQKEDDLVFEVYWSSRKEMQLREGLSSTLIANTGKVELGLLKSEEFDGDYRVNGLVRDLAKKKFEKTMFFVSPKHRQLESASFSASFQEPVGLHPQHELELKGVDTPPQPNCKLYTKYNIPKSLFLDKYQLEDLERDEGSPATGKLIGVWGETDLEAPVWGVDGWGSEALINVHPASTFDVPMHSRYEVPAANENQTQFTDKLLHPVVFWACQQIEADSKPSQEFKGLGYESMFPDDTVFYHIPSEGSVETAYSIPIAPINSLPTVQLVTLSVIVSGFLWILAKVLMNLRGAKVKSA